VLHYLESRKLVQVADAQKEGTPAHTLRRACDELLDLPTVGDVRGIGLLLGVEFVADKRSKRAFPPEDSFAERVARAAAGRGLQVYPMQGCVAGVSGDHLLVAPPAIITDEQIDWAADQLRAAIPESGKH
jgi:adenosylmethionine-8-amino-7-oxononanoate aminotransferase